MNDTSTAAVESESAGREADQDELAIRRAIHDLGSDDFEVRATARTYVLSAGEASVPILLQATQEDKQRIRGAAQWVALIVAVIVLVGPFVGMHYNLPWLVAGANIAAVIVLLAACLVCAHPAWYREANKLLAHYHSPEVTVAMIDSLVDVWGEEQPRLRAAIIHRLVSVKPEDASWLKDDTLDRVIALLSMPDWDSPRCVDHMLIIARALERVGATEAISALKGVNCASLMGERRDRLQRGLDEVIRRLEELGSHRAKQDLLRPSEKNVALVRPVEQVHSADAGRLLQAAEKSVTPQDTSHDLE